MYYAFVGHYALWLTWAAVIGFAVFLHQLANLDENTGAANFLSPAKVVYNASALNGGAVYVYTEVAELPFFSLFIMIWGSVMFEFWKRKQSRLAMMWGTSNLESMELLRPEYRPTHYVPDPVTSLSVPYYSPVTFRMKLAIAGVVVGTAVAVVVSTIAAIMVLKVFLSLDAAKTGLTQSSATYVGLVFNAVAIQILAIVYKKVAVQLTEWENHPTDSKFESALIVKSFVFSFCNCFGTLFYVAFLKRGEVILGQEQLCVTEVAQYVTGMGEVLVAQDQCFGVLGYSLLIIFVVQIIKNNIVEIVIPTLYAGVVRRESE